jgi:hypothetical protein
MHGRTDDRRALARSRRLRLAAWIGGALLVALGFARTQGTYSDLQDEIDSRIHEDCVRDNRHVLQTRRAIEIALEEVGNETGTPPDEMSAIIESVSRAIESSLPVGECD